MAGMMAEKMGAPQESVAPEVPEKEMGMPQSGAAEDPSEESAEPWQEEPAPEEQDAYDRTVMAAMKVIYDDSTHQHVMKMLQSGRRPDEALAEAVSMIMIELDRKSGNRIPEAVILPAGMEVLGMLAELAQTAGLFDGNETTITAAAQQVVLKLMREYGADPAEVQSVIGKIDPARAREMVAQQSQASQAWAPQEQPA